MNRITYLPPMAETIADPIGPTARLIYFFLFVGHWLAQPAPPNQPG